MKKFISEYSYNYNEGKELLTVFIKVNHVWKVCADINVEDRVFEENDEFDNDDDYFDSLAKTVIDGLGYGLEGIDDTED